MSKLSSLVAGLFLMSSLGGALHAADSKVDGEGFVRDWLMLAPFALPEDTGADAIDMAQVAKEGDLKPKAGDTQKVGDKEGTWKAVTAKEYNLDVNVALGTRNEDVLAYLVTYIVAEADMPGLTMAIGSNDQAKVWLNGKQVIKFAETRGIEQDSDKAPGVALTKGVNVVVFKVINQKNDWAAALRFLDKDGKAVTGLTVKSAP
jgi:hypothetical protein